MRRGKERYVCRHESNQVEAALVVEHPAKVVGAVNASQASSCHKEAISL
jgi:hypothetical protein